jgi:uncharacterized protein YgiM (DUF1202 family)
MIDEECNTVIAVNGLNIREKPTKNAKIIGKIPFGKRIKHLTKYSFEVDTITDYFNVSDYPYGRNQVYKFTGKWAKIEYEDKIGYVLDAYLFYAKDVSKAYSFDKKEYALLYSYSACYTNMYSPSKFIWYGLFKHDEKKYSLKRVDINYFSKDNEISGGKDIGVSTGNDKGLMLIIGSKKTLKEGPRNCADMNQIKIENNNTIINTSLDNYGIEVKTLFKNDMQEYLFYSKR